jgi:hypothetical protein
VTFTRDVGGGDLLRCQIAVGGGRVHGDDLGRHYGDFLLALPPEDRPSEQWIAEQIAHHQELERLEAEGAPPVSADSWLRIPPPSLTYDLDRGLGERGTPFFERRRTELCACTLAALRAGTAADESIYAVDAPEGAYCCFRLWPHRLGEQPHRFGEPGYWRVKPFPDGDDQVYVSSDFRWGMYLTWGFDDSTNWALTVFGLSLLDAFSALAPEALNYPIRADGQPV